MKRKIINFKVLFIFLLNVLFISCAHRSEKQVDESNKVSAQSAPVVKLNPSDEIEKERSDHFNRAYRYMQLAANHEAASLWKQYLDKYLGMKQSVEAQYYYARTLFNLARYDEASEMIKPLIEMQNNHVIFVNGRLLFAEILIKQTQYDQAIATTYDLMPEAALEKKTGIIRSSQPIQLDDEEKVKILTMRGRIFAELKKENDAIVALNQARKILKTIRFAGTVEFQREQKDILTAHVAFRQIETMAAICRNKVFKPTKMSEAEFIQYANDYYSCAKPTQSFMCEVLQVQDNQVRNSAIMAYREMAEFPVHIKTELPPPARRVKASQKDFYKKEMSGLIDTTVQKFSYDFRNLKKCDNYDVF